MDILVVNWQDLRNPLAGGAEVHLQEIFSRIAGMGNRVTVCVSSYPGAAAREEVGGMTILRKGGRQLFNFRFMAWYLTEFRRGHFDIVVDDLNKIPFFTPLFVRRPICGIGHHLFNTSIFRETNMVAASYVYVMERLALRLYRRRGVPFAVVSPSTRDEFVARGFRPDAVNVVHLAVDHNLHRPDPSARSSTPLIGYFGRLKKYKSVDHLLHALASVRRSVPGVKLVVVGEGDDRQRLEALAHRLAIHDIVEFTGFVPPEQKVELLQRVWFKVTTSSKEGWGLTVVEANACGTPVIASDVPGLRDSVRNGETGLLYPYGDIERLTRCILGLLENGEQRERLSRKALAWASGFTWDEAARKTIAMLEQCAAAGNHAERD